MLESDTIIDPTPTPTPTPLPSNASWESPPMPRAGSIAAYSPFTLGSQGWDFIRAEFAIMDDADDIWYWAQGLTSVNDWAKPTGTVMVGQISLEHDATKTYALGLQVDGESKGIMAVWSDNKFYTVEWDIDDFDSDYTTPQWILEPKVLEAPGDWSHPVGLGKEWGQKVNLGAGEWRIWTYQTRTSSRDFYDWDNSYSLIWVESFGPVWKFAAVEDFKFNTFKGGASALLATASTLGLLLAALV